MGRRHIVTALAVLLLLGSGCQGLTSDRPTVTPASVPSTNGSTTTDVTQLVEHHRQALRNESHTTTVTLTVTYPNGSVARRTDTFVIGSDDTYLYERETVGPYPATLDNRSVWQNDTHEVRREGDTVTVQRGSGVDGTSLSQYLERLLGAFDLTAEPTRTGYRLTGSAERAQRVPLPALLVDHRNATADVLLREDVLRSVAVVLQADRYETDETVGVEISVTADDVGATDPTRPTWAGEA